MSAFLRSFPPLAVLLLVLVAGCSARNGGAPFSDVPPELARDARLQGTVEEQFDPELDVQTWRLIPMLVTGTPFVPGVDRTGGELRLGAIALAAGPDHPIGPNQTGIQLFFMGISADRMYEGRLDGLHLQLNGSELEPLPVSTYRDSPGQGYVLETIGVRLPPALLLRIARARSVEGRLGPTGFSLGPDELLKLRAFVEALPPEVLGTITG